MRHRQSSFLVDGLHICVLVAFAVAQPLFDSFARSPEFFLVRRSRPIDFLLVTLALVLLLPGVLLLAEALAGLAGRAARRALHVLLIAGLGAAIVLPVLGRTGADIQPAMTFAGAGVLGALFAIAYLRFAAVGTFLTVLSPAIFVFPALFLLRPPISLVLWPPTVHVARQAEAAAAPVVMLVFDEFPVSALLDPKGEIDAARFPHFAALAQGSTWFRNASSVASVTHAALPAILTGTYPDRNPLLKITNRTSNLFALLAGSHDLRVVESDVPFCPEQLCGDSEGTTVSLAERLQPLGWDVALLWLHLVVPPALRAELPDLTEAGILLFGDARSGAKSGRQLLMGDVALQRDTALLAHRAEVFDQFLDRIDSPTTARPAFYYLHILLPHVPWVYFPSGRVCVADPRPPPLAWPTDETAVAGSYERLLLQVGYVDTLIGKLVARLKERGLYDPALLVVTADHGESHRPGDRRRAATPTNYCDIFRVPLFMKAPGQRTGEASDRNVEQIDILPTMASLLGIEVPWPVDGSSALDRSVPERPQKHVVGPFWGASETLFANSERVTLPASLRAECTARERERFPLGSGPTANGGFGIGPYKELVGRRVEEVSMAGVPRVGVELAYGGLYQQLEDPSSALLPCTMGGIVYPLQEGAEVHGIDLAVSVNGTIEAVTRTTGTGGPGEFAAILPDGALRAGHNAIEVFALTGQPGREALVPTRGNASTMYTLRRAVDGSGLVIASSEGKAFRVEAGAIAGEVERVEADADMPVAVVKLRGWARDGATGERAASILVFRGDRFVHATVPRLRRPDVEQHSDPQAAEGPGFEFFLPAEMADVRVFAITAAGVASELPSALVAGAS